jgi:hypothetical protein
LLDAAVRNNAAWCEAVCRAQSISGRWTSSFWMSDAAPPPFYPDLVTLAPDGQREQRAALSAIAREGCSAKDSFAALDLSGLGASTLFEALWQWRPHESAPAPLDVVTLHDETELAEWEEYWRGARHLPRIFRAALLADANLHLYAIMQDRKIAAGGIGYVSHGVVGLTNLFGPPDGMQRVMSKAARNPEDLPVALYAENTIPGFMTLGPLRVWAKK